MLLLMKAFWFYGRYSDAMSAFSRFALLSQKSQFRYRRFSIVWLPGYCLLLFYKAKPAWIKRIIHYIILQYYNPWELLKEIHPYLKRDFWYKRSKFWKWHCLRKCSRINTPENKILKMFVFIPLQMLYLIKVHRPRFTKGYD